MRKLYLPFKLVFITVTTSAQMGVGTTTPNSTLDIRGSLSAAYRTFTATTAANTTDHTLVFTGTTAAAVTLPDATTCAGRSYWIKNASSNSSVVTVNTTSSQTIDGLSSWSLVQLYKTVLVVSNGVNWYVASESLPGSNVLGAPWVLGGNNVAAAQNFGNISNFDLPFITNNTERMRLSVGGNLGIGATVTDGVNAEKLLVDAGSNSYNVISGRGNNTGFLQLNIKNSNSGTGASSDVVATNDAGTEANGINYVDMGINSSTYNVASFNITGASDAYLYATGNDFAIGNATSAKALKFFTGGTLTANERMRIDGNGNVGIGTTGPLNRLHVTASANPLYLGGVQTGAGSDSLLTIINGVVRKLSPAALTTSSSNAWALVGNSNTLASNYFLGTTNSDPLVIKVNNAPAGRIDLVNTFLGYQAGSNNGTTATQSTGIGYHALNVNSSGTFNTAIGYNSLPNVSTGSNNIGVGNNADVGSANSNSIAIGANTSINNSNAIALGTTALAFNSYAMALGTNTYSSGTNSIAIGSGGTANKTQAQGTSSLALGYTAYAGGTNSISIGTNANTSSANSVVIGNGAATSQANSIILGDASNSSINVGIGTNTPSQKLDVGGNFKFSGALMPNNLPGNVGEFLISTGAGSAPTWFNASPYISTVAWVQDGNAGTTSTSDFLGTKDFKSFKIKTNNTQGFLLDSLGNVAIGTSPGFDASNRDKLLVDAGSTSSSNVITAKGDINSYLQFNIQNANNGTTASSDVIATANNGTSSTVYIDMGINSQGYATSGTLLAGSNTAYLYATGTDFYVGNGATGKDLIFFTNSSGTTGADGTERMRITSTATVPGANNTYTLGSSTRRWSTIYSQNALNTASDRRLKTNIANLNYGLKEIMALEPVSYNWKTTPDTDKKLGLIAQDVRKIIPEVVKGEESKETLTIAYSDLIPVLINAIKEQQKIIDRTEKEVDELKIDIETLKAKK